jgi:O-antigen/teichoic acid export membrane protein
MSLAIDHKATSNSRLGISSRAGWLGIGWASLAQLVGMVIRLGSNLILTRLLVPEAYGLFGTAMAVVTTLEWLSDLGIQPALIRHPDGDKPTFLATGWWLGLWRGTALSAIAAALSWPLAQSYGQPALALVLACLALRPVIIALRSPGIPLLRRTLNYRAIFVDEVTQTVVATAVSLTLAWLTHSIWSIVAGTLAGALAGAIVSYVLCGVYPKRVWDKIAAHEIAHLGHQVFINTMVMAVWLNMDRLLGLKLVGEREMGYYAVAWNLAAVAENLMSRACDVYFSMLSRKGDHDSQRAFHHLITSRVAVRLMPLMALGVVASPFVIGLLYDSRYAGAKILFSLMMARLMIRGLGQVQFQYLLATADVKLGTRAYFVAMLVQMAILFPLARTYGVEGLALAGLISTTALTVVQTIFLQIKGVPSIGPLCWTLGWMGTGLAALYLTF